MSAKITIESNQKDSIKIKCHFKESTDQRKNATSNEQTFYNRPTLLNQFYYNDTYYSQSHYLNLSEVQSSFNTSYGIKSDLKKLSKSDQSPFDQSIFKRFPSDLSISTQSPTYDKSIFYKLTHIQIHNPNELLDNYEDDNKNRNNNNLKNNYKNNKNDDKNKNNNNNNNNNNDTIFFKNYNTISHQNESSGRNPSTLYRIRYRAEGSQRNDFTQKIDSNTEFYELKSLHENTIYEICLMIESQPSVPTNSSTNVAFNDYSRKGIEREIKSGLLFDEITKSKINNNKTKRTRTTVNKFEIIINEKSKRMIDGKKMNTSIIDNRKKKLNKLIFAELNINGFYKGNSNYNKILAVNQYKQKKDYLNFNIFFSKKIKQNEEFSHFIELKYEKQLKIKTTLANKISNKVAHSKRKSPKCNTYFNYKKLISNSKIHHENIRKRSVEKIKFSNKNLKPKIDDYCFTESTNERILNGIRIRKIKRSNTIPYSGRRLIHPYLETATFLIENTNYRIGNCIKGSTVVTNLGVALGSTLGAFIALGLIIFLVFVARWNRKNNGEIEIDLPNAINRQDVNNPTEFYPILLLSLPYEATNDENETDSRSENSENESNYNIPGKTEIEERFNFGEEEINSDTKSRESGNNLKLGKNDINNLCIEGNKIKTDDDFDSIDDYEIKFTNNSARKIKLKYSSSVIDHKKLKYSFEGIDRKRFGSIVEKRKRRQVDYDTFLNSNYGIGCKKKLTNSYEIIYSKEKNDGVINKTPREIDNKVQKNVHLNTNNDSSNTNNNNKYNTNNNNKELLDYINSYNKTANCEIINRNVCSNRNKYSYRQQLPYPLSLVAASPPKKNVPEIQYGAKADNNSRSLQSPQYYLLCSMENIEVVENCNSSDKNRIDDSVFIDEQKIENERDRSSKINENNSYRKIKDKKKYRTSIDNDVERSELNRNHKTSKKNCISISETNVDEKNIQEIDKQLNDQIGRNNSRIRPSKNNLSAGKKSSDKTPRRSFSLRH